MELDVKEEEFEKLMHLVSLGLEVICVFRMDQGLGCKEKPYDDIYERLLKQYATRNDKKPCKELTDEQYDEVVEKLSNTYEKYLYRYDKSVIIDFVAQVKDYKNYF